MKLSDKLTDAFIYKWEVNDFVYYIGSSWRTENKKKKDLTIEELLEESEKWHRKQGKAEGFKDDDAKFAKGPKKGGTYEHTFFRKKIQYGVSSEYFKTVKPTLVTQPKDMTRGDLLKLEGQYIRDLMKIGQCVWNVDYNPYQTFKDKNG